MKSILIFFISILILSNAVNATIIYTNVEPDVILIGSVVNRWDNYSIDIDTDGSPDFTLTHFYPSDDLYYTEFQVVNFKVAEILVDEQDHPLALNLNDNINVQKNHWLVFSSFAIHIRDNWLGAVDKYLAVRIKSGIDWRYAWIRLDIPIDERSCTLKDFAIEMEPNKGINAGEKPNGILDNRGIDLIHISPNPASDYFEISVGAPVILSEAKNPEIGIYDVFGRKMHLTPVPFSIVERGVRIDVSSLAPGVYFVRIGARVERFVKI